MPFVLAFLYCIALIGPGAPSTTSVTTDVAGNVTHVQGENVYQYDGLGRLVQVNSSGDAMFDADGKIIAGEHGSLAARYVYDGSGRLIRAERPLSPNNAYLHTEDYYYDGVRRIQEVFTEPEGSGLPPCEEEQQSAQGGGGILDPEAEAGSGEIWIDPDGDGGAESSQTPCDPSGGGGPITYVSWTDREYVYGTEDVNEYLLQIGVAAGTVYYVLQDANLNVVALTRGTDPGTPLISPVLDQYSYEPYGALSAMESLGTSPTQNRVGFQGMFFLSFNPVASAPQLSVSTPGVYFANNRFYRPEWGRWITPDPNETGQLLVEVLASNG